MNPIDGIFPVEVPAAVELRLNLKDVNIIKKALGEYWVRQPFGTPQEQNVHELLEGFDFIYGVLREDEIERVKRNFQ